MRRTFLAYTVWALVAATECAAQAQADYRADGLRQTYPMVLVDEAQLPPYPSITFNRLAWDDAKACRMEHLLIVPAPLGADVDTAPPLVRVVPLAATIRVHDMTLDSLLQS